MQRRVRRNPHRCPTVLYHLGATFAVSPAAIPWKRGIRLGVAGAVGESKQYRLEPPVIRVGYNLDQPFGQHQPVWQDGFGDCSRDTAARPNRCAPGLEAITPFFS